MWRHICTISWFFVILGYAGVGFAYDVIEVENGATLTGKVAFTGTLPMPQDVLKSGTGLRFVEQSAY